MLNWSTVPPVVPLNACDLFSIPASDVFGEYFAWILSEVFTFTYGLLSKNGFGFPVSASVPPIPIGSVPPNLTDASKNLLNPPFFPSVKV